MSISYRQRGGSSICCFPDPARLRPRSPRRWIAPRGWFLSLLILVAACERHSVPSNFHLSTVDYWPEENLLFVGTRESGRVDVLRVTSSTTSQYVQRLEEPIRKRVVRLAMDRERGRLWVADLRAAYIYHFKPLAPTTIIGIPGTQYDDLINDLSIDADGNGYLHTRAGALIYRVDARTLKLEEWLAPFQPVTDAGLLSWNRVLHTKDQRYLLLQSPKDAAILRVDIRTREIVSMKMNAHFNFSCGLLLWTEDWRQNNLLSREGGSDPLKAKAIDCLDRWTADVQFRPDFRRAAVTVSQ